MLELKFRGDKRSLKKLSKVQNKIDKIVGKHPSKMSSRDHRKLKKQLNNRARALSRATGMEIHSLFE